MEREIRERRTEERRSIERRAAVQALPGVAAPEEAWQNCAELIGCTLETTDGAIGVVEDFVVEAESSAIAGLVVAPGFLSAGTPLVEGVPLVLPLGVVERIDWQARKLYLRGTREQIYMLG